MRDADLLAAARAAATAARELLHGVRPDRVSSKRNPRDLVTEWDVRSEQLIRRVLEEHAPGVPVIGEEGGGTRTDDVCWLVDPIDGTVNFAHGLPLWSVSIGAVRGRELLAGVVVAPALGWWFEATRGGGARDGTGAPLAVSAVDRLDQALLVTGFPSDLATNPDNNLAEWNHLQRTAGSCRRLGSAAIDLCLVATGQLDGYWETRLQPWDLAAGALIAREAGATVTDLTRGPFDPFAGAVVATNGAIHEELIGELDRVRRAAS